MGRPSLLTEDRSTIICDAVRKGASASRAASVARVSKSSVLGWAERGRAERERLAQAPDDAEPLESEAIYLEFLDALERAADEFVMEGLDELRAAGGVTTVEESVANEEWVYDGPPDADGQPSGRLVKRSIVVKTKPVRYWQAWGWLLERTRPDEFAQVRRTEFAGLEAALRPTQPESVDAKRARAQLLVDELRAKRQQKGLTAPIDAHASDDVVADAEIVDDEDDAPVNLADALGRGV